MSREMDSVNSLHTSANYGVGKFIVRFVLISFKQSIIKVTLLIKQKNIAHFSFKKKRILLVSVNLF